MKKILIITLAIMLLLGGCSAGGSLGLRNSVSSPDAMPPMEGVMDDRAEWDMAVEEAETTGSAVPGREQRLIREGFLQVTVDDAREYSREAQERAEGFGGFVSNLSQYSNFVDGREYVTVSMQLRIPEARFDELVFWVEDTAVVASKDIGTTDVTEEYVDLEARIRNLKAQESRLQEIAGQAETVEDLLAVERELGRIRGEVESLEGRFRYLQDRVQYSTLHLTVREERTRPADISGFSLTDVLRRAGSAFTQGIYAFLNLTGELMVRISYALPFLLFILFLTLVIILLSKRAIRKKDDHTP